MKNFMFQSRNGALGFAALVVIGALVVVGGEEDPGAVVETSEDIAASRAEFQRQMADANDVENVDRQDEEEPEWADDVEFDDGDEELIDDTQGFDPSPVEDGTGEHEVVARDI